MDRADGYNAAIAHIKEGKGLLPVFWQEFSFDRQLLNRVEIELLRNMMRLPVHFQGLPQFEWVHELGLLCITYQSYKDDPPRKFVPPYYLKQNNNRWFLLGLNNESPTFSF